MRAWLVALCAFVLRIYFRRIEVVGLEHIPASGSVMFVLNHPNGLLDPVFVLTLARRRVSFLAKEALFRTFFVSVFVKAFECLPVHRAHDGGDPRKNKEMIERAIELLESGNAIAIFPEGVSHSDPGLRPFRTGAARIALSASSPTLGGQPVSIVPCGLSYSEKSQFRSRALVSFGPPLVAPAVALDEECRPPAAEVRELTNRLERALQSVTVHAPTMEVLRLAQKAERIIFAARHDDAGLERRTASSASFEERRQMRQLMVLGYQELVRREPGRLHGVLEQLETFEEFMLQHRLNTDQRVLFSPRQAAVHSLAALLSIVTLLPLAVGGIVVNFVPYQFVAWFSVKYAKGEEDIIATVKLILGMLSYPAVWLSLAVVAGVAWGWLWGLLTFLVSPLLAYAALLFLEQAGNALTRGFVTLRLLFRPSLRRRIVAERRRLRDAIAELEQHLPLSQQSA